MLARMIERRDLLNGQLADAKRAVQDSEERIHHHNQSIVQALRAGRDTLIAQELLAMAIATHATHVATVDRLKMLISRL